MLVNSYCHFIKYNNLKELIYHKIATDFFVQQLFFNKIHRYIKQIKMLQ